MAKQSTSKAPALTLVQQGLACAACGEALAASDRFCAQCGVRVHSENETAREPAPPAPAARPRAAGAKPQRKPRQPAPPRPAPAQERKHVSVLFVDLCDSTAHVQGADPEEARAYLDEALQLMIAAVECYGGTVSQLLGDGLLALFGAPVAQEDHALRACLAARTMQLNARARIAPATSPPLVLRVGVHSGEVIVGLAGQHLWSHYRADGTTIHLASRLEKLAAPGTVLLSSATQRLVADQLDLNPLGARSIRGMDEAMELFELVVDAETSAVAPLAREQRFGPLVGREALLAKLDSIAQAVQHSGTMRVVGLRGEAGIGKSRLITEWCASPALERFSICTIHARGHLATGAYSMATDLVRSLLDLSRHPRPEATALLRESWPADGLEHLAAVCDLLELGAAADDWLGLTPTQRRGRITEAVQWLITRRAEAGPLLVVIEDVFLADPESQRLLEWLTPKLQNLPVLFCGSYRQDFVHRWADVSWFVEHWLAPLPESDMTTLCSSLVGEHESLADTPAKLVERADGNPFYLAQLVFTLVDEGALVGSPGCYRLARPQTGLRTPASISAVICARVDRLAPHAKQAIEAAAVLGDPIGEALIAAMQDVRPRQAAQALRLGAAAGLLTRADEARGGGSGSSYVFHHGLVQEVVLGTLTRPRRKELNRRAFEALESVLGAGNPEAAPTLTRHALAGECWEAAATYAVKSMARAVSRSANREALRLFEAGVDAAQRVQPMQTALALELGLLLEAVRAQMALGQIDAIYTNLKRADAIAEQLDDQHRRATVGLQIALFFWMRSRFTEGLERSRQALEAGRRAGRRNLQLAASEVGLMMLCGMGRFTEAATAADAIERDFEAELRDTRLPTGWATAPAITLAAFHGYTRWRLGDYAAAQKLCDRAHQVLGRLDHAYSRGLIDSVLGPMWVEQGRYEEARRLLQASAEGCIQHGVPTLLPVINAVLGAALARGGQADQAVHLLDKALTERTYDASSPWAEVLLRVSLGVALRLRSHWPRAIESGQQAVDLALAGELHGHRTEALYELGETLRCAGHSGRARECFEQALGLARSLQMPVYVQRASMGLAQLREVSST